MPPSLTRKTPQEEKQATMNKVAREVLGNKYLNVAVRRLDIKEDFKNNLTKISCTVTLGKKPHRIQEEGKGPIDALFKGFVNKFKSEYPSLKNLCFDGFSIKGDVENNIIKPSAMAEAVLIIAGNRTGNALTFRDRATSINKAAINVVLKAFEHYINSERAIKILSKCVKDAKRRNRGDLYDRFIKQMAILVEGVSYEKILDK